MDTLKNNSQHKLFLTALFCLICLVFVILIISVVLIYQNSQILKKAQNTAYTPPPSEIQPTEPLPKGTMTLTFKNGVSTYKEGETITLLISASSDNKPITGYDAFIEYNKTAVQFIKVNNLIDDYLIFPDELKKSNLPAYAGRPAQAGESAETTITQTQLIVTAVKKLTSNQPIIFKDTSLIELVFKAKTSDSEVKKNTPQVNFNLSLKNSNLIDQNTKDVLGQTEGVVVSIVK